MPNIMDYNYPNRYLCNILEDLRSAHKARNYSYLEGLIEELQWAGNRMEAAIGDMKDIDKWREERSKLKEEINKLEQKKVKLKKDVGKK